MSEQPEDRKGPEVMPYSTPGNAASVSVASVFAGIIGAIVLTFLGGALTGICCGIAWSLFESSVAVNVTVLLGAVGILCLLLWIAARNRKDRNPSFSIGIYIGMGVILLIFGACFIGAIR